MGKAKKILGVGIYLRLSNEDRDKINKEDYSESIKNQRNMLIDFINKHEEFYLVDEYCDEDLSGAGTYRPEFERLINDCQNHRIEIVLCKSQSRFSRDMEIVEKYINNKFKEWGIRFIGLSDNADTEILGNKKSRQINGLVNEWFLEDVSNNIRSAFNSKMKQGEFISPFAPFGYKISSLDNNKLVIDVEASIIVKMIYNLYLNGLGFTGIAKYLNNKKIPSPSLYKYHNGCKLNIVSNKKRENIKWNINAIKNILTNEVYLGHLIQGKRTTISYKNHKIKIKNKEEWIRFENTHEAIIDTDVFNKVQNIIKERKKAKSKTGEVHIFSGKVFCMVCQSPMRKKNSQKYEYLVCSKNDSSKCQCLNNSSIRYDKLESIVTEEINKLISNYYNIDILNSINYEKRDSIFIKKVQGLKDEKEKYLRELEKVKKYFRQIYEDKINGVISLEQFKDLVLNYNDNTEKINIKIKSIDKVIEHYEVIDKKFCCDNLFKKYKVFTKLNRVIIDEFIDKIYIGQFNEDLMERDIKIVWNF